MVHQFCEPLLNIPEAISEGEEKAYKFLEQQEAVVAETERLEEEMCKERQQKLQMNYQRLKHDQEHQQQQK